MSVKHRCRSPKDWMPQRHPQFVFSNLSARTKPFQWACGVSACGAEFTAKLPVHCTPLVPPQHTKDPPFSLPIGCTTFLFLQLYRSGCRQDAAEPAISGTIVRGPQMAAAVRASQLPTQNLHHYVRTPCTTLAVLFNPNRLHIEPVYLLRLGQHSLQCRCAKFAASPGVAGCAPPNRPCTLARVLLEQ